MEIPVFGLLYIFRGLTGGCKIWYGERKGIEMNSVKKQIRGKPSWNQIEDRSGNLFWGQITGPVANRVWRQVVGQVLEQIRTNG